LSVLATQKPVPRGTVETGSAAIFATAFAFPGFRELTRNVDVIEALRTRAAHSICRKICTRPLARTAKVQYDLHIGDQEEGDVIMPRFTPGELKVMRILWEHGELKPAELQERFPEPIKNPALRSYLTTLVEKGHVTRRRAGKAFYYKAATRSRSAFRTMLGELVDAYCGGSVQALVMNIIKSERLSEDELLELKRLADAGDSEAPPERRSRK
jgi:BlaI family transcriptional regulator, penicillinase repressor